MVTCGIFSAIAASDKGLILLYTSFIHSFTKGDTVAVDAVFATAWVGVLVIPYAASARLTTVSSLSIRV